MKSMGILNFTTEQRGDGTTIKRLKLFGASLVRIQFNQDTTRLVVRICGIVVYRRQPNFLWQIDFTKNFLGIPLVKTTFLLRQQRKLSYILGLRTKTESSSFQQWQIHYKLMNDRRFRIDFEFYQRHLQFAKIKSYDVVRVKLKDLKLRREHQTCRIDDTRILPMRYLQTRDKEIYHSYLEDVKLHNHSITRFESLIESVETDYDETFMPVIDEDNFIRDGQHRCCILFRKYGENHEISALRLFF